MNLRIDVRLFSWREGGLFLEIPENFRKPFAHTTEKKYKKFPEDSQKFPAAGAFWTTKTLGSWEEGKWGKNDQQKGI
jgi:hypothetical protein